MDQTQITDDLINQALQAHMRADQNGYGGDGAKDERTRFVAVLEIPPVVSAETAVRVQIVKDVKEGKTK